MLAITTRGSAYERGFQHGQQAAPLIREIHDRYSRKGVLQRDVTSALRQVERLFPELIEEMEGIAIGSGIPKDEIFRMNLMPLGAGPACSVAGIRDEHGNPWIAKTDDIGPDELGSNILRRDVTETGASSLQLHFAGTIWTSTACTAGGFCMAMTGMAGPPGPSHGLPPQVLWRILPDRCATAREAVAFLERHELDFGGMSLLLADSQKTLLLVEKTTEGQCVRELSGSETMLCHTNHACLGVLNDTPEFLKTALGQNSRERMQKLQSRVSRVPRNRVGLQSLLLDHALPGALCQHGGGGLHTDYAVVFSPSEKGVWLTQGPPCKTSFEFFAVEQNTQPEPCNGSRL